MTQRRALPMRMTRLQLALSIALGVWLGFALTALTGWILWRLGAPLPMPLAGVAATPNVAPIAAPPHAVPPAMPAHPAPSANAPSASEALFDQYQQRLYQQDLRQAEEAARANPANQANPGCQFWLQQVQTAPSDHSREQVARLCN